MKPEDIKLSERLKNVSDGVVDLYGDVESQRLVAKHFNITRSAVQRILAANGKAVLPFEKKRDSEISGLDNENNSEQACKEPKPDSEEKIISSSKKTPLWAEGRDSATGTIITARKPKTLEDATKMFKVDMDIWTAERMVINSWDVTNKKGKSFTNYQVKVWFKKKVDEINPKELADMFIEQLSGHNPFKYKDITFKESPENNLLEITNFDLHLGRLGWHQESGENYDIKIAETRFMDSISDLLKKAKPFSYSRILFPVGNDFFNADTTEDTTTLGTKVDSDVRWKKRTSVGNALLVAGIDMLRQTAPVDVKIISGNHDWMTMFMSGEYLTAWYRNCKNINIDNSPKQRKYYYWNNVLLGFTHGNKEKPVDLFAIMAQEQRTNWAKTKFREWHIGHIHHEKAIDYKGVVVRWLPSLAGADEWTYGKGFVGSIKGSEAFLWNEKQGLIANFHSNIII